MNRINRFLWTKLPDNVAEKYVVGVSVGRRYLDIFLVSHTNLINT